MRVIQLDFLCLCSRQRVIVCADCWFGVWESTLGLRVASSFLRVATRLLLVAELPLKSADRTVGLRSLLSYGSPSVFLL
jgi:hypothetical protein